MDFDIFKMESYTNKMGCYIFEMDFDVIEMEPYTNIMSRCIIEMDSGTGEMKCDIIELNCNTLLTGCDANKIN